MSIKNSLAAELKKLNGYSGVDPKPISLSIPDKADLAVDFLAVDSMSCSFRELRLRVPSLAGAGIDVLKRWGEAFCSRITYLLENIGPLEVDAANRQVLIRSTPPDSDESSSRFYEILLQSHSNGNFTLRRYCSEKGTPGRTQVDIQTTHEVLARLIDDLVDTIPVEQA